MRYIDIIPKVSNEMFLAKIVMNDYDVQDQMVIRITARKNDGTYKTKVIKYPEQDVEYTGEIPVYFFGMNKSVIAQIVSVRINGVEVMINYTQIDDDTYARYDDSITRMSWTENMNNIRLYFQVVGTDNPKTLRVVDESEWGILADRAAIIEVVPPGRQDPSVFYLGKNQVNIFNSLNLCLNEEEDKNKFLNLPDGIYDITIKGSPSSYNFNRKYLKTDVIRLDLDKVWARAGILCDHQDDDLMEKIKEVEFLLTSAEANTRIGNIIEAESLLEKAQRLMEIINNCDNCKCQI